MLKVTIALLAMTVAAQAQTTSNDMALCRAGEFALAYEGSLRCWPLKNYPATSDGFKVYGTFGHEPPYPLAPKCEAGWLPVTVGGSQWCARELRAPK